MDAPGLFQGVKAALDHVNWRARYWTHHQYGSEKYWSMQVFQALEGVIHKQAWGDTRIAGGVSAKNDSEWLYDLSVYKFDNHFYTDVCLTCECEWSYNWSDLADDFLKLCQAKSPIKIFIFGVALRSDAGPIFDALDAQAQYFEIPNFTEHFLLACWNQGPTLDENGFQYRDLKIGACP